MNVWRESRSASQSSYAKYYNTHWLRPPPSREDCEKCAASPGLMIMITNMPQVPKSETFWHGALRNSLAKYSPLLLIPLFTPPLARPSLKVGAYFHIIHSFAHPSIFKMWILAHHHCLITRALYPVYMYSPPLSLHFPQSGGGCSPATFHFGSETRFHFRVSLSFFGKSLDKLGSKSL